MSQNWCWHIWLRLRLVCGGRRAEARRRALLSNLAEFPGSTSVLWLCVCVLCIFWCRLCSRRLVEPISAAFASTYIYPRSLGWNQWTRQILSVGLQCSFGMWSLLPLRVFKLVSSAWCVCSLIALHIRCLWTQTDLHNRKEVCFQRGELGTFPQFYGFITCICLIWFMLWLKWGCQEDHKKWPL